MPWPIDPFNLKESLRREFKPGGFDLANSTVRGAAGNVIRAVPCSTSHRQGIHEAEPTMTDIIVIGAGPAGVLAALRAAELGARTMPVTTREFGGMAANDGPVPVRT